MARPLILPLSRCTDRALVGGKAASLSRLLAAGLPVPPGICLTTEAYRRYGEAQGGPDATQWTRLLSLPAAERPPVLADCRSRINNVQVDDLAVLWEMQLGALGMPPDTTWAVRSSATNEDGGTASFAGLYRTHLGLSRHDIAAAVTDLWASVWEESVVQYWLRRAPDRVPPSMAVVIQPTMQARVSGVCHSIHPVTGRFNQVTVNAVLGLAVPLVEGLVTPDHYVVQVGGPARILRRSIAVKSERLTVDQDGARRAAVAEAAKGKSALSDEELTDLAGTAKRVEQIFGHPVDLEWLYDARQLWIVQARPLTAVRATDALTDEECEWTRANFKETMPDVPSPMGLSFLKYFMETYIVAHYRRLGCAIPEGISSVRVLHGRPYLNATLFHTLVAQLGGDPSLNAEHMGGMELLAPPGVKRVAWPAMIRAGWLMLREMRRCTSSGPAWFADMKQRAVLYHPDRLRQCTLQEVAAHLDALHRWLDQHEITFGIAAGVGQCLQAFGRLLPGWLGNDWRGLFNAALQGQGTVISAQQIHRVAELAQVAQRDDAVREWFAAEPWTPAGFREQLAGTEFLARFEEFLRDYGHRAVGESDVMCPRMAEQPDSILSVVRAQLRVPAAASSQSLIVSGT
jgi:rifampicin phosphotransferase